MSDEKITSGQQLLAISRQECDALLASLGAYKALLRMPHDAWRAQNQDIFARVLDRVAGFYDSSREDIQNHFEAQVALEAKAEFRKHRRATR